MRAFVRALESAEVLASANSGGQTGGNGGGSNTGGGSAPGGGNTGGGGGSSTPQTGYTANFGTRPASSAISLNGVSNTTISNKYFSNIGNDVTSISLQNCDNIIIEQCDFQSCCEPICLTNCTNITVRYNRAKDITGPHTRNGSNRGNLIQIVYCGEGIYIGYNIAIGGDTEDFISLYESNGTSSNPIIVEYNQLKNNPSLGLASVSGSGVMCGDGGGSYQIVRNNILDTPGQVGIGIAGGNNIQVLNNTLYGVQWSGANIAMYVANYGGPQMSNETVQGNTVNWVNSSGTQNPFYTDGSAGTVNGQNSNTFGANISEPNIVIT